jgi:hypothetical protein
VHYNIPPSYIEFTDDNGNVFANGNFDEATNTYINNQNTTIAKWNNKKVVKDNKMRSALRLHNIYIDPEKHAIHKAKANKKYRNKCERMTEEEKEAKREKLRIAYRRNKPPTKPKHNKYINL